MTIRGFLMSGRQAGWTPKTLEGYRWRLEHMEQWLTERDVRDSCELGRSLLTEYGADLWEGRRASTVKGSVACIRSYLRWLEDEELGPAGLVTALRIPRVPKRKQRTIYPKEFMALIDACGRPVEHGLTELQALTSAIRNAAIVSLLYDSILRAGELTAVKVEDLDLGRHSVYVASGKGGDDRDASFSDETAHALREWLRMRRAPAEVPWLFISITGNTPGQQLTVRGLRSILKSLGERAGVPDVAPHAFRRGGVTEKMKNGMPVRHLQDEAGWSSVRMADVYSRAYALSPEEAQERVQYSPVASARRKNGRSNGRPQG